MRVSATIITFNEERNIARVIESLGVVDEKLADEKLADEKLADEVLVIDSGSTDRTCEIAARLGARVVHRPWPGYAAQKNHAASCATHPWILSLDADEALTPELAAEILAVKAGGPEFDAYSFPRLAQYLGRWIHHGGWYPDRKVRLYHRDHAEWTGAYVHESVCVTGRVGELRGDLLHYTCASLSEHLRTLDRYTTLAAEEVRSRGGNVPLTRLLFDPAWTFLRTWLLRQGFRDGAEGLAIAWMAALYTFLKYAKARRPRARKEAPE